MSRVAATLLLLAACSSRAAVPAAADAPAARLDGSTAADVSPPTDAPLARPSFATTSELVDPPVADLAAAFVDAGLFVAWFDTHPRLGRFASDGTRQLGVDVVSAWGIPGATRLAYDSEAATLAVVYDLHLSTQLGFRTYHVNLTPDLPEYAPGDVLLSPALPGILRVGSQWAFPIGGPLAGGLSMMYIVAGTGSQIGTGFGPAQYHPAIGLDAEGDGSHVGIAAVQEGMNGAWIGLSIQSGTTVSGVHELGAAGSFDPALAGTGSGFLLAHDVGGELVLDTYDWQGRPTAEALPPWPAPRAAASLWVADGRWIVAYVGAGCGGGVDRTSQVNVFVLPANLAAAASATPTCVDPRGGDAAQVQIGSTSEGPAMVWRSAGTDGVSHAWYAH